MYAILIFCGAGLRGSVFFHHLIAGIEETIVSLDTPTHAGTLQSPPFMEAEWPSWRGLEGGEEAVFRFHQQNYAKRYVT